VGAHLLADPLRVVRTLRLARRTATATADIPPQDWAYALPEIHTEITRKINPARRHRTSPRAVKRARHNNYRVKQPGEITTRHDGPATIRLRTITPRAA
jgi:hypothetical protein